MTKDEIIREILKIPEDDGSRCAGHVKIDTIGNHAIGLYVTNTTGKESTLKDIAKILVETQHKVEKLLQQQEVELWAERKLKKENLYNELKKLL